MTHQRVLPFGLVLSVMLTGCDSGGFSGEHVYGRASDIRDSRVVPYMPPAATDITLFSELNGHYATYKISEEDFHAFLADVWKQYEQRVEAGTSAGHWLSYSEEEIASARAGDPVGRVVFRGPVADLGWTPLTTAVRYPGPRRQSSAGADYYYDRDAGLAYHDAGYW